MFDKSRQTLSRNVREFKEFAFKGNLIQLAIGVVLGGAFGNLIKSFVDNILMPLISIFDADAAKGAGYTRWQIKGVKIGAFIGDMFSFLIVALAIFFLMVKVVGWIVKLKHADEPPAEPATKDCPFCLMSIPYKARKCGHCTADLPEIEPSGTAT